MIDALLNLSKSSSIELLMIGIDLVRISAKPNIMQQKSLKKKKKKLKKISKTFCSLLPIVSLLKTKVPPKKNEKM